MQKRFAKGFHPSLALLLELSSSMHSDALANLSTFKGRVTHMQMTFRVFITNKYLFSLVSLCSDEAFENKVVWNKKRILQQFSEESWEGQCRLRKPFLVRPPESNGCSWATFPPAPFDAGLAYESNGLWEIVGDLDCLVDIPMAFWVGKFAPLKNEGIILCVANMECDRNNPPSDAWKWVTKRR